MCTLRGFDVELKGAIALLTRSTNKYPMGVNYVMSMQNVLHAQPWVVLRELAISNNRIILHSCFTDI